MKKKLSRLFIQRLLAWLALALCLGSFLYTYRRPISIRLSYINPFYTADRSYSSAEVRRLWIDLKRSYPCVQDVIFYYHPVDYSVYCCLAEVSLEEAQQVADELIAQLRSEKILTSLLEDHRQRWRYSNGPREIGIRLSVGPNETYFYAATAYRYERGWHESKPNADHHIDNFQTWYCKWYDNEGSIIS